LFICYVPIDAARFPSPHPQILPSSVSSFRILSVLKQEQKELIRIRRAVKNLNFLSYKMSPSRRLVKPFVIRPFRPFTDPFMMNPLTHYSRQPYFMPFDSIKEVYISETEQYFKVETDVPGLNKDQIRVEAMGSTILYMNGNYENNGESTSLKERSFERFIELPAAIDPGKITATVEEGVLKVTLPKANVTNM
jgi:HSP20 family molecular chaperone IbpA